MPPAKQSSRRFCFTINNPTDDDITRLKGCDYSYLLYGNEICPTTGTPHLQGYMEFDDSMRFTTLKKVLPRAHIEAARGSVKNNKTYCKKDQSFFEDGTPKEQGARNDLAELVQRIMNGEETVDNIATYDPMTFHQYGRTLQKAEDLYLRGRHRTWMTTCDWFYGPTGTGKSHEAFDNYSPITHYVWKNDNGWQDGYAGQPIVIINDFRGEIPYNELLQLIDKYPYTLRRRGREPVPFLAKNVVITSSLPPDLIYKNREREDSLEQLLRRIKIRAFNTLIANQEVSMTSPNSLPDGAA